MGYGPRGIDPGSNTGSSQLAFGDEQFYEFVYNDVAGGLTIGKPLYVDITDAAEYNAKFALTALVPATGRTGGRVVLGTNAKAGTNLLCVGIFAPDDQSTSLTPNPGDVVRVCSFGRCIVSAQSTAASTQPVAVGTPLFATSSTTDALCGNNGVRVSGLNIGLVLATRSFLASGAVIAAAGSAVSTLVNAFVNLT